LIESHARKGTFLVRYERKEQRAFARNPAVFAMQVRQS